MRHFLQICLLVSSGLLLTEATHRHSKALRGANNGNNFDLSRHGALNSTGNHVSESANAHSGSSTTQSAIHLLATDRCPGGYTYNDRCFWSGGSRTWDQCETYCSGQGRRMICVDSAATNSFLLSSFPGNQFFTIGLNDKASSNNYVWSGGCSPSSYRNWEPGQPNGGSAENCIVFAANGKWHDVVCNGGIACGCESSWTYEPTANPTQNPTLDPTKNPTLNPTKNPTLNPTANPTVTPTCVPTSQPSRQPSSQPSRQPSRQPTRQPSSQPSRQPTAQPSARPTLQPSRQPSMQPSAQPMSLPTCQPSDQPSSRPSGQPSTHPSMQPTTQPSSAPSGQPSNQPSALPSCQPSSRPSTQPSFQPSSHPSAQPSSNPRSQPSAQPTGEPSGQPSNQPTSQPSVQPSNQPSTQPSTQPSSEPSGEPTSQPSMQPSGEPTSQPSAQPSTQPSVQPSGQPSTQPSAQPSTQPSKQPSGEPTGQPSMQPSTQPSSQPSGEPTNQPSAQPSSQPSLQPSVQPSSQPTLQPSGLPSAQPSSQPSGEPTSQPTARPSMQPSMQPSAEPSGQPTTQPSGRPSTQPSGQPSAQPSVQPSDQPSTQPTSEPSSQPTMQPTEQPQGIPTSQPTCAPSELPTSEWAVTLHHLEPPFTALAAHNGNVWTCSDEGQCVLIDAINGDIVSQFGFENSVHSVLGMPVAERVVVSGSAVSKSSSSSSSSSSEVAHCTVQPAVLSCDVLSFEDANFIAATFVSHFNKLVHIGQYNMFLSATIINMKESTAETYVYSMYNLKSVVLSQIVSPPRYVGSFVAGTAVRKAGAPVNYILFGKLPSDTGALSGVYLSPASGSILNNAELVNAMALEHEHPDSFIAGGLQLTDGAGMHAYVMRIRGLFGGSILYCVRYRLRRDNEGTRRALAGSPAPYQSAAKSVVVVGDLMFLTVDAPSPDASFGNTPGTAVSVLQTNAVTGDIYKQVTLVAVNGSFTCSEITYTGYYLTLLCALQSNVSSSNSTPVVISVDTELTFKKVPTGLVRTDVDLFEAENVPFTRNTLTVTSNKAHILMSRRTFNIYNVLSDQPTSSPTAAPSISPQPTSSPSTSGPTNTRKPTVKPTQQPTVTKPTVAPSKGPTPAPTARPSAARTARPSRSDRPTRAPTVLHSSLPTIALSGSAMAVAASFLVTDLSENDIIELVLVCVGSVVGFFVCLHIARKCLQWGAETVEKDNRRMIYMKAYDAPSEPYYPILRIVIEYMLSLDPPETVRSTVVVASEDTTVSVTNVFTGRGAYVKGRGSSIDLEANMAVNHTVLCVCEGVEVKQDANKANQSPFNDSDIEPKNKNFKRKRRHTATSDCSAVSDHASGSQSGEKDLHSQESNCCSNSASSVGSSDASQDSSTDNKEYTSDYSSVLYSINSGSDYNSDNDSLTDSTENASYNNEDYCNAGSEGYSSVSGDMLSGTDSNYSGYIECNNDNSIHEAYCMDSECSVITSDIGSEPEQSDGYSGSINSVCSDNVEVEVGIDMLFGGKVAEDGSGNDIDDCISVVGSNSGEGNMIGYTSDGTNVSR